MVRFDIHQPEGMSTREFIEIWDREADAALGAMDAGAAPHLWKVSGQRVVFAVIEFARPESVDRALAGLPIVKEMGGGVQTEAYPIYDYRTLPPTSKEQLSASSSSGRSDSGLDARVLEVPPLAPVVEAEALHRPLEDQAVAQGAAGAFLVCARAERSSWPVPIRSGRPLPPARA